MRHRLVVVAPTTVDVVRSAGGWLFDRAMAGWDVTVLTADRTDARPLAILGARAVDLESALELPGPARWPEALAVHAELRSSDDRVRRIVFEALAEGRTEVWLWGDRQVTAAGSGDSAAGVTGSPEVAAADGAAGSIGATAGRVGPMRHRLSVAARAFKAQALAAAAAPNLSVDITELFVRGELPRPPLSA